MLAVVLHAVAAGFLGGLDHQPDRAGQRHAALAHGLHCVQRRRDGTLVVDGAAPVQVVAHAGHLERVELRAVVEHPFVGHHGHHVGVREDAEGVRASAGQGHLEHAVIHVAVGQAEVPRHALHHLAERDDGRVLVLRHLFVAHGADRHHLGDALQHGGLVVEPVIDAEQPADIDEIVALERLLRPVGPHGRRQLRLGLHGGGEEGVEAGRRLGRLAGHQAVQRGFGQRLGQRRAGDGNGQQRDEQGGQQGAPQGGGRHGRQAVHRCLS
ncbi:hypothetical protein D3C72_1518840 [compost metagenome]